MPTTSSEELALVEQEAKYEAIKELLEMDLEEESPTPSKLSSVSSKLLKLEEHYLNLKVAHKKYKKKYAPSTISLEDFNHDDSAYTYNDNWIKSITKEYSKASDAVGTWLEVKNPVSAQDNSEESKVNVATKTQIEKIVTKINLESGQITETLDNTYMTLQSLTNISPAQSQAYITMKNELIQVLDDKLPALVQSVLSLADPTDQETIDRVERNLATLEFTEKPRLYKLSQLIAEKTGGHAPQSSSSSGSSSISS